MNVITLGGSLGERFGGPYRLDCKTLQEGLHGLGVQIPGLLDAIRMGSFRVKQRRRTGLEIPLDENTIGLRMEGGEWEIMPALAGDSSSGKGLTKALLGVALIGVTVLTGGLGGIAAGLGASAGTASTLAAFSFGIGAMLALGGIAQMLAPSPSTTKSKDSFTFDGPVNSDAQGGPVPVCYGRIWAGSIVAGSDLGSDDVVVSAQLAANGQGVEAERLTTELFPNYPNTANALN